MTTNSTFRLLPMARMLRWKHLLWVVCFYLGSSSCLQAQSFSEGFDNIATLPGDGWVLFNASSPLGTTDWFQGNPTVFPAFNGAGDSYIGANFQNTSGTGTISNWLMSPTRNFNNGDVISFYTRTVDVPTYPDRLRLMLSSSGASTAIASFTTTLLTVNAGLTPSGYPNVWTQFSVTLSGLPAGGSTGRFALWYDVPSGGPTGDNSDYIGIDQVVYTIVPPSLCPAFGDAPPNVSIVNSTCSSNIVSGGSITAPGGTPCPAGSTLQYQVNSGSWSTIPPTYNQTGPVQSIKTRCVCDDDDTQMSAESIAMMTAPGVCPPLGSDFCGEVVTTVTYNSTGPVAINDATTNTATITVSGAGAFLTDLNMTTFILHTFAADLDIRLTSPSGTVVTITTDNGAGNDNVFNGTVWDDSAPTPVTDHVFANLVTAPLLTPEGAFGAFIGEDPNGVWTLTIVDDLSGDVGTLTSWSLEISTIPSPLPPGNTTTYNSTGPVAINDFATNTATITVSGAGAFLTDLNMTTFILHTFASDLDITLTSPSGTVVTITTDNGGGNDDVFNGTVWDDSAPTPVTDHTYVNLVTAPLLTPEGAFGAFIGEDPNGVWTLTIVDDLSGDFGTLTSWSLEITTCGSDCSIVIDQISTAPETCPNAGDGGITITAGGGAGPLTYSISGPSNQSNSTGVFTGLPDGSYTVTVSDGTCDETDSASVAAGTDNTPPQITCNNTAVTFNGQAFILLSAAALVSASDNCGIGSISISNDTIFCTSVGQVVQRVITVIDLNGNPATCNVDITVGGLPCGWSQSADGVGCTNGNSIAFNPATAVWTATSTNCYYAPPFSSDSHAFAQRQLCGNNGSITVRIDNINGQGWAGIVMRESNAPGAKKAQLMTNLSSFNRMEFRSITGAQAYPQQIPFSNRRWLRITRAGNQFQMFTSLNGITWQVAGAQQIVMSNCIQVGLILTNFSSNSTVSATFSQLVVDGSNVPLGLPGGGVAELAPDLSPLTPDFSVFPNPTSGKLNLDLTQYIGRSVRIEMYSIEGRLLQFREIDEVQAAMEQMDMSQLENGMYLVKVRAVVARDGISREGHDLPAMTKRIVLQRE